MSTNNTAVIPHKQNQSNKRFGLSKENSFQQLDLKIYSALFTDDAHLDAFGSLETVFEPEDLVNTNSILILHGGEDISPAIYGQTPSKYTRAGRKLSQRDKHEVALAEQAIKLGIPIFGICRGAQLACAIAGGSLVQHVENHVTSGHNIITATGETYKTSSCHHQMMFPWEIKHELLAWTAPKLSDKYVVEHNEFIDVEIEPEVVFFPEIKALAIQGHPEWMSFNSEFVQYCLEQTKEKLL